VYRDRDWGVKATLETDGETGAVSGIAPAALAIDSMGNTYVVGRFVGTVHLGPATLAGGLQPLMFVAKLNRTGAFAWARQGDPSGEPDEVLVASEAHAVTVARDGAIVVTGGFAGFHTLGGAALTAPGGAYVARLKSSGAFHWVRQIDGNDQWPPAGECDAASVASDAMGNSYVTGTLRGTRRIGPAVLTSVGGSDAYVAKIDTEGRIPWAVRIGSDAAERGQALAVNDQGEIWLAGNREVDPWYDADSRCWRPRTRVFVTRLNPDGGERWTAVAAGDDTWAAAIVVDSSSHAFLAGDFLGSASFDSHQLTSGGGQSHVFVTRLNGEGQCTWVAATSGSGNEQAASIALDAAGNPCITGAFSPRQGPTGFGDYSLSGSSESGLFVGRLDRLGRFDWARTASNSGSAWSQGIAIAGDGVVHLAGSFLGSLQLGATTLTEPRGWNLFVTRLSASPPRPVQPLARMQF